MNEDPKRLLYERAGLALIILAVFCGVTVMVGSTALIAHYTTVTEAKP